MVRRVPSPACHLPLPPEPCADVEILEQHGEAQFQHFRVGEARIGHVGVDARRAGKAAAVVHAAGRRAGADRLVILVLFVAEGQVVHRALRIGERAHGAEHRVGDVLRGLDIAGDDRRRIGGPQHAAVGDDDVDRPQAAGIHRDVVLDHDAEGVEHGGARHRLGRVEIVLHHRRGAGEVDGRLALGAVDGDLHLDDLAGVGRVFVLGSVRQALQHAAHALGGVVLDVAHIGLDDVEPEMRDHLAQLGDALLVGGDLRLEVGDVLVRVARRVGVVGEDARAVRPRWKLPRDRRCGNCRSARLPRRPWWRAASSSPAPCRRHRHGGRARRRRTGSPRRRRRRPA